MDSSIESKVWCENAIAAVASLWDFSRCQAWRGSQEHRTKKSKRAKRQFRPTATYNAVLAFGECDAFLSEVSFDSGTLTIPSLQLEVRNIEERPVAGALLKAFLKSTTWVKDAIESSEHGIKLTGATVAPAPRICIMLGRLVPAVSLLVRNADICTVLDVSENLVNGLTYLVNCLLDKVFPSPDVFFDSLISHAPTTISPQIVMHGAVAVKELQALVSHLRSREVRLVDGEKTAHADYLAANPLAIRIDKRIASSPLVKADAAIEELLSQFKYYFHRHIDYLMARKHVEFDPNYDVASLAFAVSGLSQLDDEVRATSFFHRCVAAIVEGQNPDGCWPEGITIASYEKDHVAPVRQPSVEIALSLVEAVFRKSALTRCFDYEERLIELILPPLKRQLKYLIASFQHLPDGYTGWADDRLRANGEVRMQVNATAARLIHRIRLVEFAASRAKVISTYRPEWPLPSGAFQPEEIWSQVVEPDQILKPCELLQSEFIAPIAEQFRHGNTFVRPAKNGVSFILFGPPGSGKTYVVAQFARALGWPLLNLNPGYFIEKGLESIEAIAGRIFDDMLALDHAVVFFDECDELFRQRSDAETASRNILSFATASMLPKLQKLHDARRVIFILGTNFARNIDSAIRRPGRFDRIILFDRPDDFARVEIASQAIAKFRKIKVAGLSALDLSLATTISTSTRGLMVEQVIRYTNLHLRGLPLPTLSAADYIDWCKTDGTAELKAAGVARDERKKVRARWVALT